METEYIYRQKVAPSIELDLSQAVMMKYDRMHLERVKSEGMNMLMYTRYVDDSNQIVESGEQDEELVAPKIKVIANDVLDGIEMEEDLPGRYEDGKLPILDMKCWIGNEGMVNYVHYEKPMASRLIIPASQVTPLEK